MEKFLDFLEVLQWFKPARVKSCWRTDFKNGGLRCTPQSILRSLLGYSLCLQLENWWSGRYPQPLSLPCQGLCGMAAGMYAAVVDGYRTQPAPRGDYWANSIPFPQHFTLLWKSAERTNYRCATRSSERQLTSNSCNSVPIFSALSYPAAESSPMWRCLREKQWWAQFLSRKRRTKLRIISQTFNNTDIQEFCCLLGAVKVASLYMCWTAANSF